MTHLPSLPAKATLIGLFKTLPETKRCCAGHRRARRARRAFGRFRKGQIAALHVGDPKADIPAKMRPVLELAAKLTERTNGLTKSDVDADLAAG